MQPQPKASQHSPAHGASVAASMHGGQRYVAKSDTMSVRRVLARVQQDLGASLAEERETLSDLLLVLAEVLNNVVEHSYGGEADRPIDVTITAETGRISVEVQDWGRPLPGQTVPKRPDPLQPLDAHDLPEGGFGWHIIHSMTAVLDYTRAGGTNLLTFQIMRRDSG